MLRRTLIAALAALVVTPGIAQERFITLASTSSTAQAGLFRHILPRFREQTGIEVRVVAVRMAQMFQMGVRGEVDALLVNDRPGEVKFMAEGHGIDRREVMFNDFVIVGPATDPANIQGLRSASGAFRRIAQSKALFLSRGDDSGTHRMELRLWRAAGIEKRESDWYKQVGQGMGPTLNVAAGLSAYTFTDRATWANFQHRQILEVLSAGDPTLFNPYSSVLVNPAKGPHIKAADAKAWHEWLTSAEGREAISSFRVGTEQVFFPAGTKPPL